MSASIRRTLSARFSSVAKKNVPEGKRLIDRNWRILALLASVWLCTGCSPEKKDLVIVTLDTVRPDHLGVYGYDRPTSPYMDALAQDSVVFDNAMSQAITTGPAHTSLLTGQYPHSHGVRRNGELIPEDLDTLGTLLRDQGYAAGAFVSGFPLTDPMSGLARSFDVYDDDLKSLRRNGAVTVENALAWLKDNETRQRFLWVHLYDAHGPYEPPERLIKQFESDKHGPWAHRVPEYQRKLDPVTGGIVTDVQIYVDHYDAGILYVDRHLGRLLDEIDLEKTVVLVISDHGETLGERLVYPFDHGSRLFEEQTRIAAILRAPDVPARRVGGLVGLVDFPGTLLELLGFDPSSLAGNQGRSLLPLMRGETDRGKRAEFAECTVASFIFEFEGQKLDESRLATTVKTGDHKLTTYPTPNGGELTYFYDLSSDPKELTPLTDDPQVPEYLELLDRWSADRRKRVELGTSTNEEARKKMESLGYVF